MHSIAFIFVGLSCLRTVSPWADRTAGANVDVASHTSRSHAKPLLLIQDFAMSCMMLKAALKARKTDITIKYHSTNDQSSICSLHSLELCKLKRCLIVCLKHHKTLWNCIVFLKGLKCLACLALVSSQNIARSPGATRVTTCYNFPLQPLGSAPSAAPNGWCLPAIEVADAAHSWRDPKCQTVVGLNSLSNRVKA